VWGVNTGHLGAAEQRRQASRDREALGRSRGGLSAKVHLLADGRSRPLVHVLSPGQRGDTLAYAPLMARLTVPRSRPGPVRSRPDRLIADRAYSAAGLRADLRRRRITATIPVPDDQVRHRLRRASRGGRPPAFDAEAYKRRNTVERAINRLKDHRAIAMRTDKRGYIFTGTVTVAAIRIWLCDLTRRDRSDRP
jgi:transposase